MIQDGVCERQGMRGPGALGSGSTETRSRRVARHPVPVEGIIHAGRRREPPDAASGPPRRPRRTKADRAVDDDPRERRGRVSLTRASGRGRGRWRRIVAARRCADEMSFKTCGQSTAGRRTSGTIHGRRRWFGQVLSAGRNLGRRCRIMAGRTGCVWTARRLPSERAGPFRLLVLIEGGESGRRVDALDGRRAEP